MNRDEFWSIPKLLPKSRGAATGQSIPTGGVSVRILEADEQHIAFGDRIYPASSRLIEFYRFTEPSAFPDGALFKEQEQTAQVFVPCAVYSPTFESLSPSERAYFSYFCSAVESGKAPTAAFPYLQLYLCRVVRTAMINKAIPSHLFHAWKSYRQEFPMADKLFCDVLGDLLLFLRLPLPTEQLTAIFCEKNYTARSFLLERYLFDYVLADGHEPTPRETEIVVKMMAHPGFRSSKAYRTNLRYAYTLEEALEKSVKSGIFNRKELNGNLYAIQIPSQVRTVRTLFQGLPSPHVPEITVNLCTYPLLSDENIRSRFDGILRYLENRVRSIFKLKNALSRVFVSAEHKSFIDSILFTYEAEEKSRREAQGEEALQSDKIGGAQKPVEMHVDPDEAYRIEAESRRITEELTRAYTASDHESIIVGEMKDDTFDSVYRTELQALEATALSTNESEFWEFAATLSEAEDAFLRTLIHEGKDAARHFAMAGGVFPESLVTKCNEKAISVIGDGIIDQQGLPFEDYKEQLEAVFPPMEGANHVGN
ncbi:MAG: hypothetical protein IJC84_06900 [Clostridia bacterium]|nr:hypothetical protein [Clostridia bacterium]